jgi:hypothetical protein
MLHPLAAYSRLSRCLIDTPLRSSITSGYDEWLIWTTSGKGYVWEGKEREVLSGVGPSYFPRLSSGNHASWPNALRPPLGDSAHLAPSSAALSSATTCHVSKERKHRKPVPQYGERRPCIHHVLIENICPFSLKKIGWEEPCGYTGLHQHLLFPRRHPSGPPV